jgi:transcriptional regulator with XRE-family HTH domain
MKTWLQIETQRKRRNWSRAELSRRAGLSESTIFKALSRGTRPTAHVLGRIAKALAAHDKATSKGKMA